MDLTWMGRYRELIRVLVYYSNSSNRIVLSNYKPQDGVLINQSEYQILEYICEYENDQKIMADISRDLGILPSIVTKATKHMHSLGMIEKYRIQGNHKSIVLRPTDLGRETYIKIMSEISTAFNQFFEVLKDVPDQDLKTFETAVRSLGSDWGKIADEKMNSLKLIE